MAASFERVFFLGRTTRQRFDLYEEDGSTQIVLDDTDYVRFKIGRGGGSTPSLDLVQGSVTSGGSGIDVLDRGTAGTTPAQVAVTMGENEEMDPGTYDAEFLVVDDSVASPVTDPTVPAGKGIVHIVDMMGGNTGKP
jgi:hypothetical protein